MNEIFPWLATGNTVEDSVQVCKWLEEAGVDGIHITAGAAFPHPRNPPGAMPVEDFVKTYDSSLGRPQNAPELHRLQNVAAEPGLQVAVGAAHAPPRNRGDQPAATRGGQGGGQRSRPLRRRLPDGVGDRGAIERGACDGVTIARSLLANPDLVRVFERATTGRRSRARTATSAS